LFLLGVISISVLIVLNVLIYTKFINLISLTKSFISISLFITSIFYLYGSYNNNIYKEKITYVNIYSLNKVNHKNNNIVKIKIDKNDKDYYYDFNGNPLVFSKNNNNFITLKTTKCIENSKFNYLSGMYDNNIDCEKDVKREIIIPKNFKIIKKEEKNEKL